MKWILFLILFLSSFLLQAQQIKSLANTPPNFIKIYSLETLESNQLFIAMPFAKKTVLNPRQIKMLNERVAIKVELIYTKYRTSTSFNQKSLNLNRLKELKSIAPVLFKNPLWDFELISQTNGASREECDNMFHGFVITFRPNSSLNTLDKEASYLEKVVEQLNDSSANNLDSLNKSFTLKTRWDDRIGYVHDTTWSKIVIDPIDPPDFFYNPSLFEDSTVLNAFERNPSWKNFIITTDVTGSMSPYISQVFIWLKKQTENKDALAFVFFNDGDEKNSNRKKPMKTKGIYHTKNTNIDAVIKKAALCMRNGSGGGEGLENDVEAVVDGVKQYTEAEEVILVADNFESMRDYTFIDEVKKPVHVILCGAKSRVNIQYLDLARKTKGSVHTSKSDTYNLHLVKNGASIFIDDQEYLYKNKRFHTIFKAYN